MRIAWLAALGTALVMGPAAAGREDRETRALNREIAGRVAGPAERCVPTARLGQAIAYGETLVYHDGPTVWLNRVENCPGMRGDPILTFDIFGGQLCERDLVRPIQRMTGGIPGPACQLGKFTPYRKAK